MTSATRITTLAGAIGTALLFVATASAQDSTKGEKWRTTVTMETTGMKMPGRTVEVCAPAGNPEEQIARPQQPGAKCETYDMKRTGNRYSAKMRCTGDVPMEGAIESETQGDNVKGRMQMTMKGMTMTMNFDATKLGSCEYKEPSLQHINPGVR